MSNNSIQIDMLRIYYKRLFPYDPYFQWLNYGSINPKYLANREFSFTLEDDVYVRYQSFSSQEEFEKVVKERLPCKIDIGAVYNLRPKDHRMRAQFQPVEKEMVFDIDMTDYDDVRTCCSGADVCVKCWKFLAIACKILDVAIEEDFGWKHKLWVFSGRRGIHCWICDESARKLDISQRSAVAEYLQLLAGGENQSKKVILSGECLHPSISRALDIIKEYFDEMMLNEQDILGTNEACTKFLKLIPVDELRSSVDQQFKMLQTSADRWKSFVQLANSTNKQSNFKYKTKFIVEEIMLQYAYPRLDIHVSKGLNHLLKSPFCIHPKTGKVCVPFSAKSVNNFDPSIVPTISLLIQEIDKYDGKLEALDAMTDTVKVKDYKKTSLNKSVAVFMQFLKPMEQEWREIKAQMNDQKMDF